MSRIRKVTKSALNVANAITLLRLALVPVLATQLWRGNYGMAFGLFVFSALSDLADGMVARRWAQATKFGAVADPVADKLTMAAVAGMLASQHALPWWLALAVMLRDGLIIGGTLVYHFKIGPVAMAPSRISKLNTAMEFTLLLGVLAIHAGHLPSGIWLPFLMMATLATLAWSGGDYVLVWGRKAARAGRANNAG